MNEAQRHRRQKIELLFVCTLRWNTCLGVSRNWQGLSDIYISPFSMKDANIRCVCAALWDPVLTSLTHSLCCCSAGRQIQSDIRALPARLEIYPELSAMVTFLSFFFPSPAPSTPDTGGGGGGKKKDTVADNSGYISRRTGSAQISLCICRPAEQQQQQSEL